MIQLPRMTERKVSMMSRIAVITIAISSVVFAQEKTTYDDHVFPIFQQACLNCHNPEKTKGGLDLSTFSGALKGGSGGKVLIPGDASSPIVGAVQQTIEKKMPPEGDKLSNEQIEIIKRWIAGGLLENNSSTARKVEKPKFETALRSDPAAKPDGPPPMPVNLLLDPPVVTTRPAAIHAIATSPWAPLLAITGQHQVLLHDTDSLELVGILPFPEGSPISLAFTPDGRYLIVGGGVAGKSGVTVTFDIRTGKRVVAVAKETDSVLAADIRPDFGIVATGGPSRRLKLWNTENGELIHSIKKHTDWVTALDISNDGVLVASGDRNGGVWVWECGTGLEFQTLRGHQSAITATVFRADSNILATASEDGTIRYWEMNGGSEVKKNDAHPGGVTAFAFGPSGTSLSAGRDRKVQLWKPDFSLSKQLAKDLPALPTAVALDTSEKRAFVADAEGVVRVYRTEDAQAIGEIQANPPSLAVRLERLAAATGAQDQQVAQTRKAAADAVAARDAAHQAVMAAESAHRTATERHEAAKAEAAKTPSEPATQAISEAAAQLAQAEQAIAPLKIAWEASEKVATETQAAEKAATLKLADLQAEIKRWTTVPAPL